MPVKFYIDPDHDDIFRWEFAGKWTADEYFALDHIAGEKVREMAPRLTYSIVDLRQSAPPPGNVFAGLAVTERNGPDNWVMTVLVVKQGIWLRLLKLALRANIRLQRRYVIAFSVDEAYRIIAGARRKIV